MHAAVLIATRELRDRSRLFLIAAAMAVVPFMAAFAVRQNRPFAIAMVALCLGVANSCGLALVLGVSSVGRELTEKRLSFLFAKPVSAASIWIGKAAAALLTALATLAIVVLPTYVFANGGWNELWLMGGKPIVTLSLFIMAVAFFGGHVASTMLRSRSALVALDFAMLAVMLVALFAMTRPILFGGGKEIVDTMLTVVVLAILAILMVAPIWQIARGRIDPRRNHAALSTAIWSAAAVVVIAAGAFALWVISPPLSEIVPFMIEQSPSGRWIAITGQPPNRGSYVATFLVDSISGARERLASPWGNTLISGDGRTMAWFESDELLLQKGRLRLHTRGLEPASPQRATSITVVNSRYSRFSIDGLHLSNDGSRIAIDDGRQLEVYEIGTGRLLGATTGFNDGAQWSRLFFAGPNVRFVQSYGAEKQMLRIREFDPEQRKLTTIAEWPLRQPVARSSYFTTNVTRDGSRLFVGEEGTIHDARTGAVLATLPIQPIRPVFSSMLSDGSSVVTRDSRLYYFDAKGALVREVPIPVAQAPVVGQVGTSKILLSYVGPPEKSRRLMLVNLATGKLEAELPGYLSSFGRYDSMITQLTEDATVVVMDSNRKLALWDLKNGAKRAFPS